MKILDSINSPNDLKDLSLAQMEELAHELREGILNRVNKIGGHLGPDLGIVEATIALHYVFNSPEDKFVFDVSHQCYPHKMLTGRKEGFFNSEKFDEISGYFAPEESPHDPFMIGHTSTSVSLACGLAKARDLEGEFYNVIALLGDGSLSGGEALEGLNNSAVLNSNFIVILNDNEMSIAPNQGGLYKNLELLRSTNGEAQNNMFKAIGFDYLYVEKGNDIKTLIEAFSKVKNVDHPIVVHIHTLKGKGYKKAEELKELNHWRLPHFIEQDIEQKEADFQETYDTVTTDYILRKKFNNEPVVAITPATPGICGFNQKFRDEMGKNYVDVAISEEHAVAFASGLAKNGAKPILAISSSFIQRTYDQLSQDLALNNSPATILVYWGGISAMDATHLMVFDIPLVSNIPNIQYLAPTNKEEYLAMLEYSYSQNACPVAIRVPFGEFISTGVKDETDYSLKKAKVAKKGSSVAVLGVGNFFNLASKTVEELKENYGIDATLINPCFVSSLDTELLEELKLSHKVVVTLEDGVLDGGFGEKVSRFYSNSNMMVLNYGAKKEFTNRAPVEELYKRYRLKKELIAKDVVELLKK